MPPSGNVYAKQWCPLMECYNAGDQVFYHQNEPKETKFDYFICKCESVENK